MSSEPPQPSQKQMDEAMKLLQDLATLKEKDPKAFEQTVKTLGLEDLLSQPGQNGNNFDLNNLSASLKQGSFSPNNDIIKNFKTSKDQPDKKGMEIFPEEGFTIKSLITSSANTEDFIISKSIDGSDDNKIFINLTKNNSMEIPSMKKKLNENNEEVEGLNIPLSVGPLMTSLDKKNKKCIIVDIVFHPQVFNDIYSANEESFKPSAIINSQQDAINFKHFICTLSINSVEKKYKFKINPKYKFMKMKYFHGYEENKEHKIPSQWIEDRKGLPKIEEVPIESKTTQKKVDKKKNKTEIAEIDKVYNNLDITISWLGLVDKNLISNFKNLSSFYKKEYNSYSFPTDYIGEFLIDYDKMDKITFLTNFLETYEEMFKSLVKFTHLGGSFFYANNENYFVNSFDFESRSFPNLYEEEDEDDIKPVNDNQFYLLWKNFPYKQIKDNDMPIFTHANESYSEEIIYIPTGMTSLYFESKFESLESIKDLEKSIKISLNSYKIEIDSIKGYKKKTFFFSLNIVPIKFFYSINTVDGYINFKKLNIIIFYELNSLSYNYNSYDFGSKLWQLSNALSEEDDNLKESNPLSFLKPNKKSPSGSDPSSNSYAEDKFHLKLPENVDPYTGLEYDEGHNNSRNPDDWILPEDKFHKKDISSQHIIAQREQAKKDKWEKHEKEKAERVDDPNVEYIDVQDFKAGGKYGPTVSSRVEEIIEEDEQREEINKKTSKILSKSIKDNQDTLSSNLWTQLLD